MEIKTLCYLLLIVGMATGDFVPGFNCSCVFFRLDDIQDYYLTNAQQSIINMFQEFKIPLTIGVIGNHFGQDKGMVNFIAEKESDTNWEMLITNHGYNHEDFTTVRHSFVLTI
jgi:hypothetical protein